MKKLILLAGIAAVAMSGPAYAGETGGSTDTCRFNCTPAPSPTPTPRLPEPSRGYIHEKADIDIEYDNDLDASIEVDVKYDKNLHLRGGAQLRGNINVNSSAVAVSDPKQVLEGNFVSSTGPNSVNVGSVSGNGNVGVNAASGYNNQQANIGTIASAPGGKANDRPNSNAKSKDGGEYERDGNAGWAEASTVSLQKVFGNVYTGGSANNTAVGSVSGNGNIGVNAATGAFNNQQNVMTLAVVKDGALAEANAGVFLLTADNHTVAGQGSSNTTTIGSVSGNGNMGVNAAAGVGNIQHNSLTIATST